MLDFLGRTIEVGDYMVYPGGGNRKAEYGLILLKVLGISEKGVSVERLDVSYTSAKSGTIHRQKSTIKQTTKVVKVTIPPRMVCIFEQPDGHFELVGKWIHGTASINWIDGILE